MKSLYIIGSLRNPVIPLIGNYVRAIGIDVYDSWFAGGPEADDYWQLYAKTRNLNYKEALDDWSAKQVFEMDKRHLDRCAGALLVYPAGRSGHLELGYMSGSGKSTFVLIEEEPERYDVMLNFVDNVFLSKEEMIKELKQWNS